MKKSTILFLLTYILLTVSCSDDKEYSFNEPYLKHTSLLDLPDNTKSVSYTKRIFEITNGGYFPLDNNTNDIFAASKYPYSVEGLKYMGNLSNALICNYPVTSNQYLLNELILAEIGSKNVIIKFEKSKIRTYSNEKRDGSHFSLNCEYDEKGLLKTIDIKSIVASRKVSFINRGNFLTQIIEQDKDRTDTINLSYDRISDNEMKVNRGNKTVLLQFSGEQQNRILNSINYEEDKQILKFENNLISENSKIDNRGNYDNYLKLKYKNNQIQSILSSGKAKKTKVEYLLNQKNNIEGIELETDQSKNENIGFQFEYENNGKGDWTEMSYSRNRQLYDDAKKNAEYVDNKLSAYGYTAFDLLSNQEYRNAMLEIEYAKQYCSKSTITRTIDYQ